ncbi:MAG TPA: zinc ribbon domain-containing protein [Gemmata sp.]
MTTLTCPKCRQPMPETALDEGHCPACGFPIDGPLVLGTGTGRSRVPLLALLSVLVAGTATAGYFTFGFTNPQPLERAPEVASAQPAPEPAPTPAPEPKAPQPPAAPPNENETPAPGPNKDAPRPIGVVMKVDPRIAPHRHFDRADDTAALADLDGRDHVVLTGRVRGLRIGSVNGKGSIDASGLEAEEITITGDLNNEAVVALHAPNGKVTLGGYIGGTAKLTVTAPGGEVVLLARSGRLTGSAVATVTAKRVEVAGQMFGTAKLRTTLTAGGSLKLTTLEEGATVTYKKAAATDPPLVVDKGTVRGRAKVIEQ